MNHTGYLLALASIVLSSLLMASEPLSPTDRSNQTVSSAQLSPVRPLGNMEANADSIESILENKEAKTLIEKLNAPIVLKSMEDALKHLTRASMEKIEVNFDHEQIAIFAWQGSGQDTLNGQYQGKRDNAHVAHFTYTPGGTKDLRTHSAIHIVPKGAKIEASYRDAVAPRPEPMKRPPQGEPDCDLPLQPMPQAEPKAQILEKIRE